jgi:glucose/arabinose dehydrogenase
VSAVAVFVVVLLASCAGSGSGASTTSSTSTADLISIGSGLKGPSGLTATVYATGLEHVSAFAYDADDRLWAATAAYSDEGDDGVYLVAAADATPVKVIADVHTPLGLLWYQNELYVSSNDRVDAYGGFDGSKFTSVRTVVAFSDGNGENNALVLAPDGHLLLGISAPCDHCTPTTTTTAAIMSFLPDGSDLHVYASGIRAAIGLAYYPGTNDLFATMNQRDDLGKDSPGDYLALVNDSDDWGFPKCYGQSTSACTSVPEPTIELDAHAAVSGVAIVTGELGKSVRNAAVVAEWAKAKVQIVGLARTGSTYSGKVVMSLTGFKNPEPVTLTPDGSVLVGDWTTGKIYAITST